MKPPCRAGVCVVLLLGSHKQSPDLRHSCDDGFDLELQAINGLDTTVLRDRGGCNEIAWKGNTKYP